MQFQDPDKKDPRTCLGAPSVGRIRKEKTPLLLLDSERKILDEPKSFLAQRQMSAAMIRSHGGSKDIVSTQRKGGLILSGLIHDTMANSPKAVHMKSLENLVAQTTGIPRERPIMEGVIASTVPVHMRDVPELHPVHEEDKTASRMGTGVPYAGVRSGYGMADRKTKGKKH
jgi:hypothetical protein